jgi:hypothetical protein
VLFRCKFKINVLKWKALHNQAPQYLMDLISLYVPQRQTRFASYSQQAPTLNVPHNQRKVFADRSFETLAPIYWNDLPTDIRVLTDINVFKKQLKTYYFNKAFPEYM